MAVRITAYLDGATVGCGYKFVVTHGYTSWRAYQTNRGLKRFLTLFGLTIDPEKTELHDYRNIGRGRCITMVCKEKKVFDGFCGFYRIEEVPEGAKEYIDVVLTAHMSGATSWMKGTPSQPTNQTPIPFITSPWITTTTGNFMDKEAPR